jgi:hypothetical protein
MSVVERKSYMLMYRNVDLNAVSLKVNEMTAQRVRL